MQKILAMSAIAFILSFFVGVVVANAQTATPSPTRTTTASPTPTKTMTPTPSQTGGTGGQTDTPAAPKTGFGY